MLRRTRLTRLGYHPPDTSADNMIRNSPFGWNYLLPQNMTFPHRVNRNMTMPYTNTRAPRAKYVGVWIDLEPMPPVMQEALKPWLSKLALGRELPTTDPAEAIADFEKIAPALLKGSKQRREKQQSSSSKAIPSSQARNELKKMVRKSRFDFNADASSSVPTPEEITLQSWMAKVIQLCAMKKQNDLGVELWKKFSAQITADNSAFVPELNLSMAVLYCFSGSSVEHEVFHETFNRVCGREAAHTSTTNGWNASQSFPTNLWNYLLKQRGIKGDELGILMIFRELANLQYAVDQLSSDCIILGLNAIKTEEHYTEVKERVLNLFAPDRAVILARTYTKLRSKAELLAENDEELSEAQEEARKQLEAETTHSIYHSTPLTHKELPENDKMYYHVQWHSTVRQPMDFLPRRLFFDYKPSLSSSKGGASEARRNASDIVADRIKTWKEQGLLPEDFDEKEEVQYNDFAANYKNSMRAEKWKKTPEFLNKPHLSGSLLTSGLGGKKAG